MRMLSRLAALLIPFGSHAAPLPNESPFVNSEEVTTRSIEFGGSITRTRAPCDASGTSVTPSASAATNTLARLVAERAPLANPNFTGTATAPALGAAGTASAPGALSLPAYARYRGTRYRGASRLYGWGDHANGGVLAGLDPSRVYPMIEPPVFTAATITAGSKTMTVGDPTFLRVGMEVAGAYHPTGTRIVAISGNTITTDIAATGSGTPSAQQFGRQRWDASSNLAANVVAGKSIYGGAAAYGNSSYLGGSVDIFAQGQAPAGLFLSPGGRFGLVSATRAQDNPTGGYGQTIADISIAYNDNPSVAMPVWSRYTETFVTANARTQQTYGEESSLSNQGVEVGVDPYNWNVTGQTTNLRLDNGVGGVTSKSVSTAVDIVNNGGTYFTGINFGSGSLRTVETSTPAAIQFPRSYALAWYSGAGAKAWQVYSSATSGAHTLEMASASLNVSSSLYVGGGSNTTGTDRAISVNGSNSAGFGTLVGGSAALGISSGSGYSVLIDGRAVEVQLGNNNAASMKFLASSGNTQFLKPVGFNGAMPVGKCTLSAALPTDGTATSAAMATAINAIRSCLIGNGLAQ